MIARHWTCPDCSRLMEATRVSCDCGTVNPKIEAELMADLYLREALCSALRKIEGPLLWPDEQPEDGFEDAI